MNRRPRIALIFATAVIAGLVISYLTPATSFAQTDFNITGMAPAPSSAHAETEADKRLREQVIKDDAKKNLEEATELLALATDLKAQVAKDSGQYASARAANETRRIEKLARDIRGRMNKDVRDIHF
jgi:hypothetical protein